MTILKWGWQICEELEHFDINFTKERTWYIVICLYL